MMRGRVTLTLAALEGAGLDAHVLRFQEARLAFVPLSNGEMALSASKALFALDTEGAGSVVQAREAQGELVRKWRFRSRYLQGMALLGLVRPKRPGSCSSRRRLAIDWPCRPWLAGLESDLGSLP